MTTAFIPQTTWFKVLHDTPYNHKLEFVAKKCNARMCEVLAVWLCEMDAASKHDPRGVSDADPELVAFKQGIEQKRVERIMAGFRMKDRSGKHLLIDSKGKLVGWHAVQPMTSTERSQKHRDRKAAQDRKRNARNAGALQDVAETKKPSKSKELAGKADVATEAWEEAEETPRNGGALQPLQTKKEKNQKKETSNQRKAEQSRTEQSKAKQKHTEEERAKGEAEENASEAQQSGTSEPHPGHPEQGKEKRGSAGAEQAAEPETTDTAAFVAAWNRIVKERPVTKLTDKREKLLLRRLEDSFGFNLSRFETFCRRVADSDFLMGRTGDGFKASFTWALESEDRVADIVEGTYSGASEESPAVEAEPIEPAAPLPADAAEAWERVMEELRWITGLKAYIPKLRLFDQRRDGAIVISAPTELDARWVESHYRKDIERALESDPYLGPTMTALIIEHPTQPR